VTGADGIISKADSRSGKIKFTLEQAKKAQRGADVQLNSFFNLGAR
jgi:hypothetical protein